MSKQKKHVKVLCKKLKTLGDTLKDIFNAIYSSDNEGYMAFEWDEENQVKTLSYKEIRKLVFAKAEAIKGIIGEDKDTFIALNMPNGIPWIVSFWAILATGNKPYLVNLQQTQKMRLGLVKQLGIKYCLDSNKENDLGLTSILYENLSSDFIKEDLSNFANEFALSTSGTSMQLKICVYTGAEMAAQLKSSADIIDTNICIMTTPTGAPLKLLSFLPFFHIFGFVVNYMWFAYFGSTIVLLKNYAGETLIDTIKKHQCSHVFAVPLFWHTIENKLRKTIHALGKETEEKILNGIVRINELPKTKLSNKFAAKFFSQIRNQLFGDSFAFGIVGGSYIRNSALELFNGLGFPLYVGYGATEVGITSVELSLRNKDRILNSIGKPFKGFEYKIEDECLYIKAPTRCKKIYVEGELQPFEEWFNSHDVAHEEKGRYYIDGRKSDLILSDSGENINPDLIEKEFNISSNACEGFSVVGLNNKIAMVISIKSNALQEEIVHIKNYVQETNAKLPSAFQVHVFYFTYDSIKEAGAIKASRSFVVAGIKRKTIKAIPVDEFLKKESGKVNNTLVNEIIDIFAEVLNIEDKENIRPDSHFIFDLNGDSLDYFSVINMLEKRFDFKVNLTGDETPCYTANELAEKIEKLL